MISEVIVLNKEREVTLTAYIQGVGGTYGVSSRPGLLILPGGAYSECADCEADPVAMAYAKAGYQTFILRYTVVSKGKWPLPLEDYEAAMELILSRAEEWHIERNKVAVIGFSAGGHLAACAATIAMHKPAAAVLLYPAILKEFCDACQPGMPYPNEHVSPDTAPCFLAACRDDPIDIKNSLMFELALNENGVPFESHIYSFGGHGFSIAEPSLCVYPASKRVPQWVAESIGWLAENIGELTRDGFTEPNKAVQKGADVAPMLSVDCTLGHMSTQGAEVRKILSALFDSIDAMAAEKNGAEVDLIATMGKAKIRDLLKTIGLPDNEIDNIDATLCGIENKY